MFTAFNNLINLIFLVLLLLFLLHYFPSSYIVNGESQSPDNLELLDKATECDHTLSRQKKTLLGKIIKGVWPFRYKDDDRPKMRYFLYKRDFPQCGRELIIDDDQRLEASGFNPNHPTRITIHGWLTEGRGAFSRAVTNAYLNLTNLTTTTTLTTSILNSNISNKSRSNITDFTDFNVIVVDWSGAASNFNYFRVIKLIDDLGFLLAELLRYLHLKTGLHMNNVYLIGHSLGSHIAGSAGKQLLPHRINTIFALDPAGPKFRNNDIGKRLDITDAIYVESIQTSSTLGFYQPIGHATFFVNYGGYQTNCYKYGCSHSRAYHYFAESIISDVGFWGIPCHKDAKSGEWVLLESSTPLLNETRVRMGGEPSTSKNGTFYVKTNKQKPYARGKTP